MPLKDRMAEAMRRHPKLKQADIARACKVSTPSVADWVNGGTKSLKPEPARLAAKLFGCDQNWIGTGIGSPGWHEVEATPAAADPDAGLMTHASITPTLAQALPVVLRALSGIPALRWPAVQATLAQAVGRPEDSDALAAELLRMFDRAGSQLGGASPNQDGHGLPRAEAA